MRAKLSHFLQNNLLCPIPPQVFRRFSLLAQSAQTHGIVPFGQALTFFIQHQCAVKKFRRRQTQRPIKQQLPRRARQQIRAAHDLGDLHRRVVNNAGELIRRNIIVPPHHKIAKVLSGHEFLFAVISIGEGNGLAVRNAKTPIRGT